MPSPVEGLLLPLSPAPRSKADEELFQLYHNVSLSVRAFLTDDPTSTHSSGKKLVVQIQENKSLSSWSVSKTPAQIASLHHELTRQRLVKEQDALNFPILGGQTSDIIDGSYRSALEEFLRNALAFNRVDLDSIARKMIVYPVMAFLEVENGIKVITQMRRPLRVLKRPSKTTTHRERSFMDADLIQRSSTISALQEEGYIAL